VPKSISDKEAKVKSSDCTIFSIKRLDSLQTDVSILIFAPTIAPTQLRAATAQIAPQISETAPIWQQNTITYICKGPMQRACKSAFRYGGFFLLE